ncbi:MAG: T9SS type A sorting domain-containing protein [bacterium]|nr:T9SS type A sorting domain-containing protein [bacterium]
MKSTKIGVICILLGLLLSTGIEAQERGDKNKRGTQKIMEKLNSAPLNSVLKQKSSIDRGISSFTVDYFTNNEWMVFERHDLSYNEDRTVITDETYFKSGDTFVKVSESIIKLNSNGLLTEFVEESVEGGYKYEQKFYYNNDFSMLDSVIIVEDDGEDFYYDRVEFVPHTADSIEIINYYDYPGEGESGVITGDYALLRDGNYIEHYFYAEFIDRYTYFDITVVQLLQFAFTDFQFFDVYNDEYYFATEEWVPFERITMYKNNDQVVELLTEGWYDTEWQDEERYLFEYEDGEIATRTYEYASGNAFEPESRRVYTYENATSSELNNDQPNSLSLSQNYPNPFNPSTSISFNVHQTGLTKLAIYDMLGRKVTDLVNEIKPAGSYQVSFSATGLSSGLYYYVLEQPEFGIRLTRSMTLIK